MQEPVENDIIARIIPYMRGSLYKGVIKDTFKNFKHLRQTKHTHNPVDDAKGNAEALLAIKREFELKIRL